jgi:hypothetical protein
MSKATKKLEKDEPVFVNRGDVDSYYTKASAKLALSNIEKQVKRVTKRINQIKIEVTS